MSGLQRTRKPRKPRGGLKLKIWERMQARAEQERTEAEETNELFDQVAAAQRAAGAEEHERNNEAGVSHD